MSQSTDLVPSLALHRFAVLTAMTTLALLGVGGLVTSHGVGMAVPDWPNTYGYNMFLFPVSQWVGGIFYEHTHRLVAALVGLLTAILAGWLWARETQGRSRWLGLGGIVLVLVLLGVRQMPVYVALAACAPVVIGVGLFRFKGNPQQLRWLAVVALAAVVLQGVLGGLRVVLFQDEIGIFHAALAQVFFVLVCVLALFTSRWWGHTDSLNSRSSAGDDPRRRSRAGLLNMLAWFTVGMIFCQLVLGATMRHQHAGLAIPDFPLAYGKVWPAVDADSVLAYNQSRLEVTAANPITAAQIALQMAHRILALLIVLGVATVAGLAGRRLDAGNPLRRLAFAWLGLILIQSGLGAWTIWSNKAADVATAHVLVGALSLVIGVLWCLMGTRQLAPANWAKSGVSLETWPDRSFGEHPVAATNP